MEPDNVIPSDCTGLYDRLQGGLLARYLMLREACGLQPIHLVTTWTAVKHKLVWHTLGWIAVSLRPLVAQHLAYKDIEYERTFIVHVTHLIPLADIVGIDVPNVRQHIIS